MISELINRSYLYHDLIARMKKLLFLTFIFLFDSPVYSQIAVPLDTVYLMSGKTLVVILKDSTDEKLKMLVPKKGGFKADFIDLDLIYSVKYGSGAEVVFYKQDTLFGNYFSAHEVKCFLQGERDARASFKSSAWSTGAFITGFAAGYTQNFFLTLLTPFIYSGASTFLKVKIRPGTVSNPSYLKYDTYLLGYEKEARHHRIFQSLICGGIGIVSGFITSSIIIDYNRSHP